MIDRSANLRALITGRGNSTGFTRGARAAYKQKAHIRMREAGKEQIREQLSEMEQPGESLFEQCARERKHKQQLARRRQLYRIHKTERQVRSYIELLVALKKLDARLCPEARHQLSVLGMLPRL